MANSSERARFFLEQSVPELQELLTKELFTKEEISSVARKRSDFEHLLNARGSTVADWVRYIAYEQTFEQLRAKRIRRKGVRNLVHNGQRRIFMLFDRATYKFPGDLRLWLLYLRYAKSVKAHKKAGKILTTLLRLQPHNPNLWILAARFTAYSQDDLNTARGYLQRGLRFAPKEKRLWLELVELEMTFIQKAITQLENLGVKSSVQEMDVDTLEESSYFDERALKQMSSTPAVSGGIVCAIFDAAMVEFGNDKDLAEEIFNQVFRFPTLQCTNSILRHILGFLETHHSTSSSTATCRFKFPFTGVKTTSSEFASALDQSLHPFYEFLANDNLQRKDFAKKIGQFLLPFQSIKGTSSTVQNCLQIICDYILKILATGNQLLPVVVHLETLAKHDFVIQNQINGNGLLSISS